ncbi:uncharacterized protein Z520_09009 [Fonsecaea multimorphosa CBS 102226]|uniref:Major facilitator superfamily (MFS) profile domain-containing protein n=1 Tax=Fonsecaea multimorphosa CBS 102226 TaxID=1442371 RepID=A0A0D2KEE7_9EURO|nr:uncharacterized protein Z520_09009 [Fonsecaea multimorphosa CBS 102226]KIX95093.1 hypothetical protein Z520_09009 [Fonsecaea multimorphosa CBS 102226]
MDLELESCKPLAMEVSRAPEKTPEAVDAAFTFLNDIGQISFNLEDEERLIRKIDWLLMPLLAMVYFLQFLDKNIINFANIMGLGKDTNSSPSQFSQLALAFYVAYLVFEPVMAYLLQKLPVGKVLGVNVVLWGICLALNCVCKNYASLVTLRVLLGVFEACVSPAMILICTMWYKRKEQPLRIGFWAGTVGLGIIVGALCSYGFQHYHGRSFKSWQVMFLVFGLLTILVGILVIVFLPDSPMKSHLTVEEKAIAVARLRGDTTGVENKTFKPGQFWEALFDTHLWLIFLITTAINIPNAAVSVFQAAIIEGLGYTSTQSALLSIPSGAIAIISIGGASLTAWKLNNRSVGIVLLLLPGILGSGLMAFLPTHDKIGRLLGNYLTNTIPASTPLIYSWVAGNFAGHTKKVTANAVLLMAFCLGNILGPLTFTNPPEYTAAKITIIAVLGFAIILIFVLVYSYHRQNRRRLALAGTEGLGLADDNAFLDLTDRANMRFLNMAPMASAQSDAECRNADSPNLDTPDHGRTVPGSVQAQKISVDKMVMQTVISKGNDPLDLLVNVAECGTQVSPECLLLSSGGEVTKSCLPGLSTTSALGMSIISTALVEDWSSFYLVQTGLLTAEQAVTFVDAFFDTLSLHSPVLTDYYANHGNHRQLIADEPLLCSTILLISSRYHVLPGIASISRGSYIHDQLWNHVQGFIQTLTLGGGDSRLRSLGSIEALLLLTEWYPRAVQFSAVGGMGSPANFGKRSSLSTKRKDYVIHPSRQLDRMSWMLLGTAQMLAHEVGLFQERFAEQHLTESEKLRCKRVRDLLFIYTTLLAAKLGYTSMTAITFSPSLLPKDSELTDDILGAWIRLIKITRSVHSLMFSSPVITRELLRTGNYIEILEHFSQILRQWESRHLRDYRSSHSSIDITESLIPDLLFFEFHYVCMYTKSPALQATAMRALSDAGSRRPSNAPANMPPEFPTDEPSEHPFSREVIDHAKQTIKRAIFLTQTGKLRYYPARSFQRLISACVFILKAKTLRYLWPGGALEAVQLQELLMQGIQALKISALDDSHLASYYAILLEARLMQSHSHSDPPDADTATADPLTPTADTPGHTNGWVDNHDENGQTAWIDTFDDDDLFADFTVFSDIRFDTEGGA